MMNMIANTPSTDLFKYETSPQEEPITTVETSTNSTNPCPSWKLYENPFYNSFKQKGSCQLDKHPLPCNLNNHLLSSSSARKLAASFWDSSAFRVKPIVMEKELDMARAQIVELMAEIEYERKARKRVETMYKRLAKELAEERKGREALERVCEGLAKEISSDKAEIDEMKKEIEEERRMLRMAEVLREERVQMKLAEAKILFEEKLMELEGTKHVEISSRNMEKKGQELAKAPKRERADKGVSVIIPNYNLSGKFSRLVLGEKSYDENSGADTLESTRVVLGEKYSCSENVSNFSSVEIRRRASPEPENPHIKRGIKGFVEFPRVVRATRGSKNRHWGTKLECQKAQLRILLKQKYPIRSNNFIISGGPLTTDKKASSSASICW